MRTVMEPVTRADLRLAGQWRNACREGLRTAWHTTPDQQGRFYETLQDRAASRSRYWAVRREQPFALETVAIVGLHPIQWESRLAEIALLTDPQRRRQGIGDEAVRLALTEAFGVMGLATVCGEVYESNPAVRFWLRMADRYGLQATARLPRRKMWDGKLWDAIYFTFTVESWRAAMGEKQ